MINGISAEGVALLLTMLVLFFALLWGPTIFTFRSRGVAIKSKLGIIVLAVEVIVALALIFIADSIGLSNPGGLILASTLLVSVLGFFCMRVYCVKNS